MTEDEMVGWHDRLNGHELEQAPGIGDEQGNLSPLQLFLPGESHGRRSLVGYGPRGRKE